jgi:transcriptional regulator of arginine metabolism
VANTNHEQRREAIRRLLLQEPAETQGYLVARLVAEGFSATQSSVSRDLHELGAIRTNRGYELPAGGDDGERALAAVANLLRSIHPAGPNLLVVKTAIGAAQRVALAFDRCNWPEVVGNIGGDDTVFVATASGVAQKNLMTRIEHSAQFRNSTETL